MKFEHETSSHVKIEDCCMHVLCYCTKIVASCYFKGMPLKWFCHVSFYVRVCMLYISLSLSLLFFIIWKWDGLFWFFFFSLYLVPCDEYKMLMLVMIHLKLSGYRMAAECARNALLRKVVDNKADLGNMAIFYHFVFSWSSMRLLNIYFVIRDYKFQILYGL